MNNKAKLAINLLMLSTFGLTQEVFAQQDLNLGQYTETLPYFNASINKSDSELSILLLHNRQLEGVERANKSFLLMLESPMKIFDSEHSVGIRLQNQSFGLFKDNELTGTFSSKISINKSHHLRLGIGASFLSSVFEGQKVYIPSGIEGMSQADEAIPTTEVSGKGFDLQLGCSYFYKNLSLGFGVRNLLSVPIELGKKYQRERGRSYNLYAGYNFLHKTTLMNYKPSILATLDEKLLYRINTRLDLVYNDRFLFGGVYRFGNNAVGISAGMKVKKFVISYQFEYPFTELARNTFGTHEIMISYAVPLNINKEKRSAHKSIRFL